MKRLFLLLLIIVMPFLPTKAQKVNGVIMYQNSGGQAAEGVQISAFGCGSVYSQSNGMFILPCNSKKPGQKLKLLVGRNDANGKNIEVVNSRQLEWLRLSDNPDPDPIEIVVCSAGSRDEAALRYYGILVNTNNKEYERKISNIEKQLKQKNLDANTTAGLIEQIDELRSERDKALEDLEEQAQFIASINQDHASELVKSAILKIEEEEDIEAALKILDDVVLEESYELALEKKIKAESEIKQVIEAFKLKITMLLPKYEYSAAVGRYDKIIEIHINNNFDKEELALLYIEASKVLYIDGKYEKSLEYQQKAIEIQEALLDSEQSELAKSYTNIGLSYNILGQYELALDYQQKAIGIQEETLDSLQPELADSYNNIALTYNSLGQYDKGLKFQAKALTIEKEIYDPNHPELALSYHNVGLCYGYLGLYEKALENEQKAITILEEIDPEHPDLSYAYSGLSGHFISLRQYDMALKNQLKAIDIREKTLNPKHPFLAQSYNKLAIIYRGLGESEKALEYHLKDIDIKESVFDAKHPDLATSYNNLGVYYRNLEQYEKALEYQQKSLDIKEEILDPMHPSLAISYNSIGTTYYRSGQYTKALVNQQKSLDIREKILDPEHPRLIGTYNSIGQTYLKNNKFDEAKEVFTKYENLVPEGGVAFKNWAMYYALKNDKKKALLNLTKAIEMGYDGLNWLQSDESLDGLREEKEFIELLKKMETLEK